MPFGCFTPPFRLHDEAKKEQGQAPLITFDAVRLEDGLIVEHLDFIARAWSRRRT
ncbi:hypothetical protein [Shimia sp.]|uniref:hypothetical protein n=1 Tax=Shimia sp. TaxID=1954381 RepID=UPI003B8C698C